MGARGPKPTPTEVKRKRGNPGRRPIPKPGELRPVPALSTEPTDVPVEVAMERVLTAGYWLASSDAPMVALFRDAVEDYAKLRDAPGVAAKEIRDARAEVMKLASTLGFDPTSRSALGLAEVTARSKLDEIQQRRRASGD